jgi:crotonobetainyl-CoA:carnitine CoA-transferase CaiB-like acyl-CoA transferase
MEALAGVRILEPGQLVAAPFASTLLADFGAEVIKTELPGVGDPARRERSRQIERFVRDFFLARTRDEIVAFAERHDVTIAPVQDMDDVARDAQFAARGVLTQVDDAELGPLTMVGPVPRFSETPGRIRHAGPPLGAHNAEIHQGRLGLSDAELDDLRARKAI